MLLSSAARDIEGGEGEGGWGGSHPLFGLSLHQITITSTKEK